LQNFEEEVDAEEMAEAEAAKLLEAANNAT